MGHTRDAPERSEGLLGLDESLDTVVHVLGELNLVSAESAQVRDIEDTVVGLGVLAVSTTDLDVVLVGDLLHDLLVLLELWKLDVNGSTHTGTEVGWAGGDVTQVGVVLELGDLLNLLRGNGESLEDLTDVGALLHGDDSELILLIDPDEEGLGIVVVDTTGLWPLSLKTAGLEVLVSTLEEEVISDELLALSVGHLTEGVVLALKLTVEGGESLGDLGLNLETLVTGDGGTEWEFSQVTGNTDTGGVDHSILIRWEVWAVELLDVHGGDVLVSWLVTVVSLNDLVHEWSEVIVRLVGTSVDTNARVGPLGTREDSLFESESVLVLSVLALLPDVLGEALVEERFGASWEVWHTLDVRWVLEVGTHEGTVEIGGGELKFEPITTCS